jgi:4-hydroxybenzoyl-CoA reductase subunit beta
MDGMPVFELRRPSSIAEAAALLTTPGSRIVAGGTDLVPNLRRGIERPATLVDLGGIAVLDTLVLDATPRIIGAGVTLARVATDARIAAEYPALGQAAAEIAGPAHRSAATVGGNLCLDTRCVFYNQSAWWRAANDHCLKRDGTTCHVAPQGARCHAAYCGDLAPALIALDASVSTFGPRGARCLPLAKLYVDDGAAHIALGEGELVTAVAVPRQFHGARSGYRKARVRGAIDFPLAGVAARLVVENGAVGELRIGVTGTNSHPMLLEGTEDLRGERIDDPLIRRIGKLVARQVTPMRTTVTAGNYRREVASALARRLVRELAANATARIQ